MSAELGLATMAFIAPATGLLLGIPSSWPWRIGPGPCSTQAGAVKACGALETPASDTKAIISIVPRSILSSLNPLIFIHLHPPDGTIMLHILEAERDRKIDRDI